MKDRVDRGLYWDRAWYLTHGCRPRSAACVNCWAAKGANMRQHNPHPAVAARHAGIIDPTTHHFNGKVNLDWDVIGLPLRTKRPMVWCVWDELFYGDEKDKEWCERRGAPFEPVPDEFIHQVLDVAVMANQHTIIILTKRAERMHHLVNSYCDGRGWDALPSHIIGMVTAENQQMANERIPYLVKARFSVRGISAEPLLGPLDLSDWLETTSGYADEFCCERGQRGIDWVITGPETGPGARERDRFEERARNLRDQCISADVKFFLKKNINGTRLLDGRTWDQFPNNKTARAICPGCGASIPNDGQCWYCENAPREEGGR